MSPQSLRAIGPRLDAAGGMLSIWYGRPGGPAGFARLDDTAHYAASTIKLPLLVAAHRMADAATLDLDSTVRVHDDFASTSGGRFRLDRGDDNDDEPWERLGSLAPLRWLARRMIVRSSNLATNLLLEVVGLPVVAEALSACGAVASALRRPIGDQAAAAGGSSNVVSARDLAAVLGALALGRAAAPAACAEMLAVLADQEYLDGIPAVLPPGTRSASKGGWVDGIRHDAALIWPADTPAYLLVVCTSGVAGALDLVRDIAAAGWADRHSLAPTPHLRRQHPG